MTSLVDEARVVDALYLDFSKAFDALSHKILIKKPIQYRLAIEFSHDTGLMGQKNDMQKVSIEIELDIGELQVGYE
ncbi:hypothetical protein llap_8018 [Limosa lapponica baueri]|uniref:Reverse transcriptase domain-containing protein n=1 Tax=Limosa lapponica baueri TaxID=1758121 RepID=A0A2I0U6K3_LIMLA|nr:hypothetical protein llap_8018 [Limosa lapponica baueri]